MNKTRVEVNSDGEFFLVIPDDIVDAYGIGEGDLAEWDDNDEDLLILTFD